MHFIIDNALSLADKAIECSGLSNVLAPFFVGPFAGFRRRRKRYVARALVATMARQQQVTAGLFSGMRYANLEARCSALLPKMLGTYEYELGIALDRLLRSKVYSTCIDVGSAEGYYAIGVAMLQPHCKIYAVDSDPAALKLCGLNALANGCFEQIELMREISDTALCDFPLPSPSLIISDCEGYEKKLFTDKSVRNLLTCDIIIEVHDFVDPTIGDHLRSIFLSSHNLDVVMTISDSEKARAYNVPEIKQYDLETRSYLLSEFRPYPMRWFVFTPKTESGRIS